MVGLPSAFFINAEGKNKLVFKGRIKWHDNEVRSKILFEIGEGLELPKNTYKFASLNRDVRQKVDNRNKESGKLTNQEAKK